MRATLDTFDPRLLLKCDQASRKTWDKSLKDALGEGIIQGNVRAMLADVFLRALLEVRENGATSIENALKLKSMNFIAPSEMIVSTGDLKGKKLQYVSLTPEGLYWIDYWREDVCSTLGEVSPFDILLKFIHSYLAIDNGSGIVVTKGVAQVAIELEDRRLLSRMVRLGHKIEQFNLALDSEAVAENRWIERSSDWSGCSTSKRSGAILVDLYEKW